MSQNTHVSSLAQATGSVMHQDASTFGDDTTGKVSVRIVASGSTDNSLDDANRSAKLAVGGRTFETSKQMDLSQILKDTMDQSKFSSQNRMKNRVSVNESFEDSCDYDADATVFKGVD